MLFGLPLVTVQMWNTWDGQSAGPLDTAHVDQRIELLAIRIDYVVVGILIPLLPAIWTGALLANRSIRDLQKCLAVTTAAQFARVPDESPLPVDIC